MNALESRLELMKLIKVNSRGREIKMQLMVITPLVQENNARFRGLFVQVLIGGLVWQTGER